MDLELLAHINKYEIKNFSADIITKTDFPIVNYSRNFTLVCQQHCNLLFLSAPRFSLLLHVIKEGRGE